LSALIWQSVGQRRLPPTACASGRTGQV